jgi:hypothetical protein
VNRRFVLGKALSLESLSAAYQGSLPDPGLEGLPNTASECLEALARLVRRFCISASRSRKLGVGRQDYIILGRIPAGHSFSGQRQNYCSQLSDVYMVLNVALASPDWGTQTY